MSEAIPRYLLAPEGLRPETIERCAVFAPYREVSSIEMLLGRDGEVEEQTPGWVLLPPEADPEHVLELLLRLAESEGDWSPLALLDSDELSVLPIHPGHRYRLEDVTRLLDGGPPETGLLSLRLCMREVARIRHDINNPLTAALAEVQLLLIDMEERSPAAEALRVVEAQLHRIRDFVAELTVLRAPRS